MVRFVYYKIKAYICKQQHGLNNLLLTKTHGCLRLKAKKSDSKPKEKIPCKGAQFAVEHLYFFHCSKYTDIVLKTQKV